MWESRVVGEIPKGLWELVESLRLAFHSSHQPRHFHSFFLLPRFASFQAPTALCR